jgi:hypothetical protein
MFLWCRIVLEKLTFNCTKYIPLIGALRHITVFTKKESMTLLVSKYGKGKVVPVLN